MKTLKELREQWASLINQAKAIVDEADKNERELTDDEDAKIDELQAQADGIKAEIEKLEAGQARREKVSADAKALTDSVGRKTKPEPPASVEPRVGRVHDRAEDDPTGGFASANDLFNSIRGSSRPGSPIDERFLRVSAAHGANTAFGDEGGFLIPPDWSNRMFSRAVDALPLLGKCDKVVMAGNTLEITGTVDHDRSGTTYRYGGVVVYWVGEGTQISRSQLKFQKRRLTLHKLAALCTATSEELSEVNINFGERLLTKMSEAISEELVEAIMFGTGVGKPMGAFTSDACVSQAIETGQAADTIVTENIIKMNSVIWSPSRGRGEWYYNGECIPQLETMTLAAGTAGVPAYWPAGGLTGATPASIKGRPAYETEHCLALGDCGDIVFGDFSQYVLGMKGSVETAMSIHLYFDYDETAFRATFLVDGKPLWETTLKPRKGAAARRVSPFVTLAARA